MCGIFGLAMRDANASPRIDADRVLSMLFKLSETRGREASGAALRLKDRISVLKSSVTGSKFVKTPEYRQFMFQIADPNRRPDSFFAFIGHSRLVTHGSQKDHQNNQPVIKDGYALVHNGIVANHARLWETRPGLTRQTDVDTEVIASLLKEELDRTEAYEPAIRNTLEAIEGSASIAVLPEHDDILILSTNTGSLYTAQTKDGNLLIFASERFILETALESCFKGQGMEPVQIAPFSGLLWALGSGEQSRFDFSDAAPAPFFTPPRKSKCIVRDLGSVATRHATGRVWRDQAALSPETQASMTSAWKELYERDTLTRCARCLLPTTFPGLTFDEHGVCSRCRSHRPFTTLGRDALERALAPHRKTDGSPDCLVAFSGGRDSSYGLHYLKTEMGMNPICFTYDWGMITDLGRRNQARLVGKLGVEQIIVSADIDRKRENIRKNFQAWIRQPDLGMIPILMAGDKMLMHIGVKLMKQTNTGIIIHSYGNGFEEGQYKIGFCGIHSDDLRPQQKLPWSDKFSLISYYLKRYLANPGYINMSCLDTLYAYWSIFMLPDRSLHLFRYIPWVEDDIIALLRDEYGWESEPDTIATWRIDDGTASFYNYIYMRVAGFTEFDVFRSTQIREGHLTREKALELVLEENKPRFESIEWYANTIGFDINRTIGVINRIPTLY